MSRSGVTGRNEQKQPVSTLVFGSGAGGWFDQVGVNELVVIVWRISDATLIQADGFAGRGHIFINVDDNVSLIRNWGKDTKEV